MRLIHLHNTRKSIHSLATGELPGCTKESSFSSESDHPCLAVDGPIRRSLLAQEEQFGELIDAIVPADLTRPEDGLEVPDFGGDELKTVIAGLLPRAYRQTLLMLDEAKTQLSDAFSQRALPHISKLAAAWRRPREPCLFPSSIFCCCLPSKR